MRLRALAVVSGVYDLLLGVPLLLAAPLVARLFGEPPPVPVVSAWLNGVFTVALGLGYFWAAADVEARRGYLWVAGVFAKGLGCLVFVVDHLVIGSPAAFLLFALTDARFSLLKRSVSEGCTECGACGRVCQGAAEPDVKGKWKDAECYYC